MKKHAKTANPQQHARITTLTEQQLATATGGVFPGNGGVIIVQNGISGGSKVG